jgi:hypothetical protein
MAYGATNSGKTYTIFGDQNTQHQQHETHKTTGLVYLCSKYLME